MDFFKKHKLVIIFGLGILLLYLFTRLYNIMSLPIFTDEAIYVRWAQIAKQDANWRFISLTDGKQPMFVWITMIVMRFVEDPLLAGRLTSVIAGLFSVVGLFFLGREIFKNSVIGIISAFLYVVYPMGLVYDRMALYESLLSAFAVWSLYLVILLVRRMRLDIALILGMVVGGGVITKSSGFFNIYLLPISLLIFDWKQKKKWKRLLNWLGFAFLVTLLAYAIYSILRLSSFFYIIEEKNALFVYPLKEWLMHPFTFLYGNLLGLWDWLWHYMTIPSILLIFLSFIVDKKFLREKILLFLWFLIPFIALALFGKTLYPRFIFFMTLSLLPMISFSLVALHTVISSSALQNERSHGIPHCVRNDKKVGNRSLLFGIFCLFIFILAARADYFILNDFAHAPIPISDLNQYSNDWPAGGGVKEAINFFREKSKITKIYVATQGTFGLMPYAIEMYLVKNPNVKIEGFWPIGDTVPQKVIEQSKKTPSYFVFYQPCVPCQGIGLAPQTWNYKTVLQVQKPVGNRYFTVYEIKP